MDDSHPSARPADVVLAVPEIRDYHAINSEIVRHLDAGSRVIRLAGVRGQRLLASGLSGPWIAAVEVEGDAGPELGAGLDAPGLTVICRGGAADGAASRLSAGRLVVLGDVGMAFGYAMRGGLSLAGGEAAARAGLCQSGGDIVLWGRVGPLAGDRQSGGRLFALADRIGPHAGRGHRGGRFIRVPADQGVDRGPFRPTGEHAEMLECLGSLSMWRGSMPGELPEGLAGTSIPPGKSGQSQ